MAGGNDGNLYVQPKQVELFDWEKKRAERQNVQLTPVQAELFEQQKEQRLKHHQQRLAYFKENCKVQMPKDSIQAETFAHAPAKQISAGKRKTRSKMLGSALCRKRVNAESIEGAAAAQAELLKKKVQDAGGFGDGVGAKEQDCLANFLTGDQISDQTLLRGMKTDEGMNDMAVRICYRQFMEVNLKNLDFRTDKKIASNAAVFEEIAGKVEAMKRLLDRYPEMRDSLSKDEEEDLDIKLEQANDVVNLYKIKKRIMMNPYYRTHYQSEISDGFQKDQPAEERELAMLLWGAEQLMTGKTLDADLVKHRWLFNFERQETQQEHQEAEADRVALREREIELYQPEYGKNDQAIEDSRHAEYFRLHDHEGDPIYERLKAHPYQVTGEPTQMGESFVRHLSNLPRWKAVQNTDAQTVQRMVENLAAFPVHADQAEEVAQCRQRNLEGMRTFKELLKKQMNYLKKKYGAGFVLLSPEEMRDHVNEFQNDFTNMQGLSEFMIYLKKIPGMFDPEDDSDVEMDRLVNYYQNVAMAEGVAKLFYIQGANGVKTYEDYKRKTAQILMMSSYQSIKDAMLDTDLEQKEVRWDTPFAVTAREIADEIESPALNDMIKKLKQERGDLGGMTWNMLFDEMKQLNNVDAADILMRNQYGADLEAAIKEWKNEGLTFGAIAVPGIGTDDFVVLRRKYRKILTIPEKQVQYGVDTPEKLAEFTQKYRDLEHMSVFLHQKEAEADKALEIRDALRPRVAAATGNAKILLRNLMNSFDQLGDRYIAEMTAYKRTEGDRVYNAFAEYREKIDMWHYADHKRVFHEVLEPEMEKMHPESEATIGGVTVPVYEEAKLFKEGVTKLKEGVTPEEFESAVLAFNKEFARCEILKRIYNSGETDEKQAAEPLWQSVTSKRGFFQYDVANRQSTSYERLMALQNRINDMLE